MLVCFLGGGGGGGGGPKTPAGPAIKPQQFQPAIVRSQVGTQILRRVAPRQHVIDLRHADDAGIVLTPDGFTQARQSVEVGLGDGFERCA